MYCFYIEDTLVLLLMAGLKREGIEGIFMSYIIGATGTLFASRGLIPSNLQIF